MFDFLKNAKVPRFLRSGEGELLELKEGVVVDALGKPVGRFGRARGTGETVIRKARGLYARGGLPFTIAGAFMIPVALFAGLAALTVVGGFAAIFLLLMLIESAFGIGVRPQRRG